MTLPLFDEPERPRARPITLVKLSVEIARFAGSTGLLAVEGEVHRPTVSRGGWVFFTLRDRAAQISVVVRRANVARSRTVAGERVSVIGRLDWSNDRGQLQLMAEEVLPVGAGAIAALVAETRQRLGRAGLLDRPRRGLPLLPACIGVVCGADAAVRHDIESVVAQRFPGYPVHFEETTVSGPGAAVSIVDGLARVVRRPGVEVVIVARGGGDATALLPWSDEEVCRAIAASPVPVVSAIGHEADKPLCDEVADVRCGTPSIAAARVVPDLDALTARIGSALSRASQSTGARVAAAGHVLAVVTPARALDAGVAGATGRLHRAGQRLADAHPRRALAAGRQRLGRLDWRRPADSRIGRAAGRLDADRRHLSALDPHRVLARGYAVVRTADGSVVRDATTLRRDDEVDVLVSAGSFRARVERVTPVAPGSGAGDRSGTRSPGSTPTSQGESL
jgi:exodeoxyribonuclease VII large subunit